MSSPEINIQTLKKFSEFTFEIRQFFHSQNFLEATTPTLVECPGTEPFLEPFATEFRFGKKIKKFYLPTSPEIALKKLICQGSGSVFEIKNVFRNNELSQHHSPEFLMLEWYRVNFSIEQIQKDIQELLQSLLKKKSFSISKKTMRELFLEFTGFELTPSTTQAEYYSLALKNNLNVKSDETIEDLFSLIFLELIEKKLDKDVPLFVTDYPPFQAAYAQINNSGWAERFEFYWKGLEIANAFYEVTDADEQLQRMQKDNLLKRSLGKEEVTLDLEFIELMKKGMPKSSGVALGVERLFMAIHNFQDIQTIFCRDY